MNYLGVDYGKTKIGLALSEGNIAKAWRVLPVSSLDDALVKITRVIKDESIDLIVIGKPDSGQSLKMVANFIRKLKAQSPVKIIEVSETLSTQDSQNLMFDLGIPKKKRQTDDAYSAQIILQDFLESRKSGII